MGVYGYIDRVNGGLIHSAPNPGYLLSRTEQDILAELRPKCEPGDCIILLYEETGRMFKQIIVEK